MNIKKHAAKLMVPLVGCAVGIANAQMPLSPDQPAGIVASPCPPPLQPPPEMAALHQQGPKALFESKSPAVVAFLQEENRRRVADRAGLCRYRQQDTALVKSGSPPPAVVFIGDSITDFWPGLDHQYFLANHFEGRGIGAQVTMQGLLRFEQDVVELHPKVVHILYGTNDIAGLGGPTTFQRIQDNLISMVQLARANNIAVVIGTILPITSLPGGMKDPSLDPNIIRMNDWIRRYAERERIAVADYYPALSDGTGGFRKDLNSDGVHPTLAGYRVMEPITSAAVAAAMKSRSGSPRQQRRDNSL